MDDATRRIGRTGTGTRRSGTTAIEADPVDPSLPEETDERAREIRAEIAQTRDQMSDTIEAIQDRLKPSNIVATASETVRNATTQKVKQMANTAGDAAERVMNNTFVNTVRANPIPAALIGIGAAWLWMKGRSETPRSGGDYGYPNYKEGRYDWRTRTGASAAGAYGATGNRSTFDQTGDSSIGDVASGVAERASEYADDVKYAARRTTRRAQVSFDRVLRENPLALGAAATLVGAAIGMTIPATETENELMGEARDTVVDRARGLASEAADKVQSVAGQVTDAAARATDTTRPTTGSTV